MSNYRKSIAAAVGAVITILSAAGLIDVVSPEVQAAIVTLLTVAAVYLVPNGKKAKDFTAFYFGPSGADTKPELGDYQNKLTKKEKSAYIKVARDYMREREDRARLDERTAIEKGTD